MNPKYKFWHISLHKMFDVVGISWFDKGIDDIQLFDAEEEIYLSVYPNAGHLLSFTELLDENGKDIFEGYIVKAIRFKNEFKTYVGIVKSLEGSWVIDTGNELIRLWTESEENHVLGNIYENPELLKGHEND